MGSFYNAPELTQSQTLQKSAGSYRSSTLKYFMSQHSDGLHPMSIMSTDLYSVLLTVLVLFQSCQINALT